MKYKFRCLNNKGYMLVEIILASVLAMAIAYFITDLTIKLKNKNDDLLVKTLVATDQAIIYNTIMRDIYENGVDSFDCNNINVYDKTFEYNGYINIVSDYADISYDPATGCVNGTDELTISISLDVKQLPDENFDINIKRNKTPL